MSQQSLIYSFVARGNVILAEYTQFTGNFNTIAAQCLQKLPTNNNKVTYACDQHTFNFLIDDGFVFLVGADEGIGRKVPFAFLDRVKDDFKRRYAGGRADTATAHSLDREFGVKLKDHMQYSMDHQDEVDKVSKIRAQVTEVQGIMMENIDKVLDRGQKIEILVDKSQILGSQADNFRKAGRDIRRKMWLQNMKVKLVVLGIVVALILIIWLSICHGFKCH